MFIAADGEQIAAKAGPAQDKADKQAEDDGVEHRVGDAENPGSTAKRQQCVIVRPEFKHHGVARRDHRQRPGNRQHPQCHHERRQADIGDQHPVDRPHHQRGDHGCQNSDLDRIPGVHGHRQHHRAQTQHRPHRQINAAGDDHHGHAKRDNRHEGHVAGDVEQVLGGGKGIRRKGKCDGGDDHRDEHPESLAAQKPGQPGLLLLVDGGAEGRGHRKPFRRWNFRQPRWHR